MFVRLALLFTLVPLVELAILIRIGRAISVGPTLAIILLTGLVGAALARWQGTRTLANIQTGLARGEMPAAHMVDGLFILIAGVLLITPGVITDAVGFALLVPFVRGLLRHRVRRYFEKRIVMIQPPGQDAPEHDAFIDVEAKEVTPPSQAPRDDA